MLKSFVILGCAVFFTLVSAHAETITLVADEWAPYILAPGNAHEGYMIDVAREVFKEHGITISYSLMPWKRALEQTRKGTAHGVVGATRKGDPDLVFPNEPLGIDQLTFWVRKGTPWRFRGVKSLELIALGGVDQYDYRTWLNNYITRNRHNPRKVQLISCASPQEANLRKLLAGRMDALVDNGDAVRYTAGKLKMLDKIEMAGKDAEWDHCGIAFSPTHPRSNEYARLLSKGIVQLRKSGRLKQILADYGLQDWK